MKKLDPTNYPLFLQALSSSVQGPEKPRSYPGYPEVHLSKSGKQFFCRSLESALKQRRRASSLSTEFLSGRQLGRVLLQAHGVTGDSGRGATPSAGSLQALELYLIAFGEGWLPVGGYHYDRARHLLTRHFEVAERKQIESEWVPALVTTEGGSLLWVLVGALDRVESKYSFRALQFLCLEAGHLMQSLCLLTPTVPLGGFYEKPIGEAFRLPVGDRVLYVGLA